MRRVIIFSCVAAALVAFFLLFSPQEGAKRSAGGGETATPSSRHSQDMKRKESEPPVPSLPDVMEARLWKVDELRAMAREGLDVDYLQDFELAIADRETLLAAAMGAGLAPYQESEISFHHSIIRAFGEKADVEMFRSLLDWHDRLPPGDGKTQVAAVFGELKNKELLEFVLGQVLGERVSSRNDDTALIHYLTNALVHAAPGQYSQPLLSMASRAETSRKALILGSVVDSGGIDFDLASRILTPDSEFARDAEIQNTAVQVLGFLRDERAKTRLMELLESPASQFHESAFFALKTMASQTPGLFTAEEKARFLGESGGD